MQAKTARESRIGLLGGRSPLLRLQSDERLIELIRAGNEAAFEHLFGRYRSRLMAFSRHMLASKEDAEDVMQEVFANAYKAMRADQREINVRPWLYRIARNRCLNHLRRPVPDGRDTMDEFVAAGGNTTADIAHKRADFRHLLDDVQKLPETQRTALLMREIDVLSYDQIADAMETTVPSVKSLLVRARMSLAEASQARALSCDDVRIELAEVTEGLKKPTPAIKRHIRECEDCQTYKKMLRKNNTAMAMAFPVGPIMVIKKLLVAKLGFMAAGGAHAGSGAGAATATGTTVVAGGVAASGAGSAASVGIAAVATKAAVGIALTALVAGGAVEANKAVHKRARHNQPAPLVRSAPAPTGGVSSLEVKRAEKAEHEAADKQESTAAADTTTTDTAAGDPTSSGAAGGSDSSSQDGTSSVPAGGGGGTVPDGGSGGDVTSVTGGAAPPSSSGPTTINP